MGNCLVLQIPQNFLQSFFPLCLPRARKSTESSIENNFAFLRSQKYYLALGDARTFFRKKIGIPWSTNCLQKFVWPSWVYKFFIEPFLEFSTICFGSFSEQNRPQYKLILFESTKFCRENSLAFSELSRPLHIFVSFSESTELCRENRLAFQGPQEGPRIPPLKMFDIPKITEYSTAKILTTWGDTS